MTTKVRTKIANVNDDESKTCLFSLSNETFSTIFRNIIFSKNFFKDVNELRDNNNLINHVILNSIVDVIFCETSMSIFSRFCITHIFRIFKTFDVNIRMFHNDFLLDTFIFINFFFLRDRFNFYFVLYHFHFYDNHQKSFFECKRNF